MANLSLGPITTPTQPPRRWKLWLTLSSPVLLLMLGLLYLDYIRREYLPIVTAASSAFHRRFAHGEDGIIYQEADQAWKRALSEDIQDRFFNRVRHKLGACSYTGPLTIYADTSNRGTYVIVTYRARCTNGSMQETLKWKIIGGKNGLAALVYYKVASPLLLTD